MTLSRRERQVLAAMERALAGDPVLAELADTFPAPAPRRRWTDGWLPPVLVLLVGVGAAVAGGIAGLSVLLTAGLLVATGAGIGVLLTIPVDAIPAGVSPNPLVH